MQGRLTEKARTEYMLRRAPVKAGLKKERND